MTKVSDEKRKYFSQEILFTHWQPISFSPTISFCVYSITLITKGYIINSMLNNRWRVLFCRGVAVKKAKGIRSKQRIYAQCRKYTLKFIYYGSLEKQRVFGVSLKHPEGIHCIHPYTHLYIPVLLFCKNKQTKDSTGNLRPN